MLLAVSLVLTACGGSQETAEPTESEPAEVSEESVEENEGNTTVEEQVLNISLGNEPDSLDIGRATDVYCFEVVNQFMEPLVRTIVEDGSDVVVPAAAESWDISDDGLVWTFHIREDANWSDGQPLTAGDFVYGARRIVDPETASPSANNLKHIKNGSLIPLGEVPVEELGLKAIDDKTLEITLEYPVSYFINLAGSRELLPQREDIIEEHGTAYGTEADKLIACGPFMVEEWTHNSLITLVKNPEYWDSESVKLDQINMKIIQEENALMGEFENEGIDIVDAGSAEWVERLESQDKYNVLKRPINRTSYFFFNHESEYFQNDKIRKAFTIALNRKEISEDINENLTMPAYGWVPPTTEIDGVNFREVAGEPVQDLIDENPDPQALLVEGLEELGKETDPSTVTIQLMHPDNVDKEFAEYLQQTFMNQLGINIELDACEWPVFQERNRQLDYEIGFKSWGGGVDDPSSFMDLWQTGNRTVPIGWEDEAYDELVQEAAQSLDNELRMEDYIESERILLYEVCAISPYSYETENIFTQPYVHEVHFPVQGSTVYKYAYIQ